MHRYLVVANKTLGDQDLLDVINDRMAREPLSSGSSCRPRLPRIPIPTSARSVAPSRDAGVLPTAADVRNEGIAVAKSNLETELRRLREIGATADGAVGDPDPMKAIERTIAQQ